VGLSKLQQAIANVGAVAFHGWWSKLPLDERAEVSRRWEWVARPEQLPPSGDWDTWLYLAGRGAGKSRSGAEWVKAEVEGGGAGRLAFIAPTAADCRDTQVEGESGLMSLYAHVPSKRDRPIYEPSKRRITWPNGALATLFSAEEPDRLRGPQHDRIWGDELAAWDDPSGCYDMAMFGLRLGDRPRSLFTTTPRPIPLVRRLVADPTTAISRGSTYDNADNLPVSFLKKVRALYEGTRLGRQELYAEILDDNPGALWRWAMIEDARVKNPPYDYLRVVTAIDPAVSSREDSDETGIVTVGRARCFCKGADKGEDHAFVIADDSAIMSPDEWAKKAAKAYTDHDCDRVIGEVNNGGDLVESNLRTLGNQNLAYRAVHASRGKMIRAEPIAGLYEQGKVHHIGTFPKLEDQLTQWNPLVDKWSPDRLDALVWALTDLMMGPVPIRASGVPRRAVPRRI
jgi:phage terminase large subunit-like protein